MKFCPQCELQYPDSQRLCPSDGAVLSLPDPYNLIGRTLADKYRIDALVGMGGMGAVYSAHHLGLDRRVAFKILLPHLALQNPEALSFFESEAKMAARLRHENIVQIFDAGRSENLAWIAMEWLDGRGLDEVLRTEGRFSFERAADIFSQIVAALEEAHASRIIHRDLKPSNVMLVSRRDGREQVKVVDFGIGKVLSSTDGSLVSRAMGTPAYSSPEQLIEGAIIDTRSDIYSLGIMLFEILTGQLPFRTNSLTEMIRLQLTAPPPPLRALRPDAPAALEELLNRMLAKRPEERPQHASDALAQFTLACRPLIQARPQPPGRNEEFIPPVPKRAEPARLQAPQRSPLKSLLAVGAGLAVVGLIIANFPAAWNEPRPAPTPVATRSVKTVSTPVRQFFEFDVIRMGADGWITKRSRAEASYFTEDLGNRVSLEMVEIPGGELMMGTSEAEVAVERQACEGVRGTSDCENMIRGQTPQHRVSVPAFAMSKYEVTQEQWRQVAKLPKVFMDLAPAPSHFQGDGLPVENVSWYEAREFCTRLSRKTGRQYRLPSESEWEYGCRAGTTTSFAFGEAITAEFANYDGSSPYRNALTGESREKTVPVGSLGVANDFGLFDMHGNVGEWCEDVWHENYNGAPVDGSAWIRGGDRGNRVVRGGSFIFSGFACRSAFRITLAPGGRLFIYGFRVAVSTKTP